MMIPGEVLLGSDDVVSGSRGQQLKVARSCRHCVLRSSCFALLSVNGKGVEPFAVVAATTRLFSLALTSGWMKS
eukprot:scaffold10570_cov176-Amphora_coffeaeformis.AAC.47